VGFQAGQPARLSAQDSSVVVSSAGKPFLTLAQRLRLFDPQHHGGEAMITKRTGCEII